MSPNSCPFTLLDEKQLLPADGVSVSTEKQQNTLFQWLSTLDKEIARSSQVTALIQIDAGNTQATSTSH
jgi:hypothetical protein